MGLFGLVLFGAYAAAAYLGYRLLQFLWAARPEPLTLLGGLAIATVVGGYLSYKVGTVRLLAGLQATPVTAERAPRLHRRFRTLLERMDVGEPDLRVGSLPAPNALSIGSGDSGVVVFDAGLLRSLSIDEAEAILAHELAHMEGHDALLQTLAYTGLQTLVGVVLFALLPVTLLATGLARAIAWLRGRPNAWAENPVGRLRITIARAVLVAFAVVTVGVRAYARSREYAADERAAAVTGNPQALASALRTIERLSDAPEGLIAHLTTGGEDADARLFSTHPATADRIERLRDIETEQERARWTTIPVE